MGKAREKAQRAKQRQHTQRKQLKKTGTKSFRDAQEARQLEQRIWEGAPALGTNPLASDAPPRGGGYAGAHAFVDLPISGYTQEGLRKAGYTAMTAIQRAALPHALAGRDVLGAAKTGSGKTLAFLIPLVEKLYRQQWGRLDGLGALVLTPTRELALQIFEELKKVGARHELSAGLLIGGKNVKDEAARVNNMTILVATPGRLLQHMDETPGFDASGLQVLVLDEADRILDMGFAATLDAIVANLPRSRQTMLFSATQTKSVRDLARLSLTSPEYLAVHAEAANPTPLKLQQACMLVPLDQKVDVLWSFLKTHLKAKTVIFLSTCKQVRFVHEAFRKLRPGVSLRALHGNMKQHKRLAVYDEFCQAKSMVLFATDIAARGLDFPTVDWVVQADCPEDTAAYIHRVGRTARYLAEGRALLLLAPSEAPAMLAQLADAKVPIKQLRHNPAKVQPIGPSLQALLSRSPELKDFAQRALVAYLRSVYLQPNKSVFDVAALPVPEFAASVGLLAPPKLRFLRRVGKKVVSAVEVGAEEGEQAGAGQGAAAAAANGSWQPGSKQQQGPATGAAASGCSSDRLGADAGEEESDEGDGRTSSGEGASSSGSEGEARGLASRKRPRLNGSAGGGGGGGGTAASRLGYGGLGSAAGGGAGSGLAGSGSDDGDDGELLVVKQRDVFAAVGNGRGGSDGGGLPADEAADPEAEAAAGVAAADAASKKKRKKQKIKLGAVSGQRVVFDESGAAVDPLQLLATGGELEGGTGDSDSAGGGAGVHVVADLPEDRFRAAAKLMRRRDTDDRRRAAELRRAMRADKKARAKARAEEEAAPVAVLGGGGGDWSDGGGSGSDGGGASSSDGGGGGSPPPPAARPDPAYAGMARKGGAGPAAAAAKASAASSQLPGDLMLAEQEAMALALMRRRQR